MSEHDNAELARAMINAWNARDVLRCLTLFRDDCVVESCHEPPSVGREAAGTLMRRYLLEVPDLFFEVLNIAATERSAVVSWRALGTPRNELSMTRTARQSVHGCTFVGLKLGQVARMFHYWDTDHMFARVLQRRTA